MGYSWFRWFCLTNYQSELPEFLSIGEDLDSYASLEELDEKAAYYLSHPNHAKEIAMHGLETVKIIILMKFA